MRTRAPLNDWIGLSPNPLLPPPPLELDSAVLGVIGSGGLCTTGCGEEAGSGATGAGAGVGIVGGVFGGEFDAGTGGAFGITGGCTFVVGGVTTLIKGGTLPGTGAAPAGGEVLSTGG
jgi:hypothetical protein